MALKTPLANYAGQVRPIQTGDVVPVASGGTGQNTYSDGQLLIGDSSTGGLDVATLTAGSNVTITNGHGNITIAATGGGGGGGGGTVTGAMVLISETITSGSQASVTFSSIPQTFRDLIIVVSGRSSSANPALNLQLQFNGDTGSNYNFQYLQGNSTTLATNQTYPGTSINAGLISGSTAPTSSSGGSSIRVHDYANTALFKTTVANAGVDGGTGTFYTGQMAGQWKSTAAITSATIFPNTGNFVDGAKVTLYGIGGTSGSSAVPPSGAIYQIQSQTLAASAASVTFSNLPQGFQDLQLVISGRGDTSASNIGVAVQFNGDTGSNYSGIGGGIGHTNVVLDFNQTVSGTSGPVGIIPAATGPSNTSAPVVVDIANYAGTTFDKSWTGTGGWVDVNSTGHIWTTTFAGTWFSAVPINRITAFPTAGNFVAGTVLTIYGRGGPAGSGVAPPSGAMLLISETVTSGSQATVTFSNIPQTFRDLQVVVRGRTNATDNAVNNIGIMFNSDTTVGNYTATTYTGSPGNGTSAASSTYGAFLNNFASSISSNTVPTGIQAQIFNYTSPQPKAWESLGSSTSMTRVVPTGGAYLAGAITSITLTALNGTPAVSTFNDGTVVSLFGIGGASGSGGAGGAIGAMVLIGSQTLSAAAANVSFSSIPQNYQDLVLVANCRGDTAATSTVMRMQFNGDTGANYDNSFVLGNNNTATGNQTFGGTNYAPSDVPAASAPAGTVSATSTEILAYANTTFQKQLLTMGGSRFGTTASLMETLPYTGDWRSTAAITSILVFPNAGNFVAGSTFSLYGRGGTGGSGAPGTVTNVGLSLPAPFSVSGSPIATSGTLTGVLAAPLWPPGGRLTLSTGAPVMSANVTGASTIYYDSYVNGAVPVWSGSAWTYLTITSDEVSMGLDAVTPHVASGNLYDVFALNNAGSLVIAVGPAWSSTTARGTGAGTTQLVRQNGIWTNAAALVHAYGGASGTTDYGSVSVNAATYLGTIYATANGQTGMNFTPAATAGGTNNFLGVYNAYNRVRTVAISRDSTSPNWTTTNTAWHAANAGGTGSGLNNRITFVDGLQQSRVEASYQTLMATSNTADNPAIGVNFDSTSATPVGANGQATGSVTGTTADTYSQPLLGLHFAQAVEAQLAGGTGSFYGFVNSTQYQQLTVRLDM